MGKIDGERASSTTKRRFRLLQVASRLRESRPLLQAEAEAAEEPLRGLLEDTDGLIYQAILTLSKACQ